MLDLSPPSSSSCLSFLRFLSPLSHTYKEFTRTCTQIAFSSDLHVVSPSSVLAMSGETGPRAVIPSSLRLINKYCTVSESALAADSGLLDRSARHGAAIPLVLPIITSVVVEATTRGRRRRRRRRAHATRDTHETHTTQGTHETRTTRRTHEAQRNRSKSKSLTVTVCSSESRGAGPRT